MEYSAYVHSGDLEVGKKGIQSIVVIRVLSAIKLGRKGVLAMLVFSMFIEGAFTQLFTDFSNDVGPVRSITKGVVKDCGIPGMTRREVNLL